MFPDQHLKAATECLGGVVFSHGTLCRQTGPLGAELLAGWRDLTIVGIAGGTLPLSFFSIPYEVSVQTTYWGSRPELIEVLDLGARGLLWAKVTTFTLDEAAVACWRLLAGEITARGRRACDALTGDAMTGAKLPPDGSLYRTTYRTGRRQQWSRASIVYGVRWRLGCKTPLRRASLRDQSRDWPGRRGRGSVLTSDTRCSHARNTSGRQFLYAV